MKSRPAIVFCFALVLFACALGWIFHLGLTSSDVYPRYSTLRTDGWGLSAVYDAFRLFPNLDASRWVRPISQLEPHRGQLVILAGMSRSNWQSMPRPEADWIAQTLVNGGRVLITFEPDFQNEVNESDELNVDGSKPPDEKKKDDAKNDGKGNPDEKGADEKAQTEKASKLDQRFTDLEKRFNVTVKSRIFFDAMQARVDSKFAPSLPALVPWESESYFVLNAGSPWQTLYSRSHSPVMIQRPFGRGTLILATDSYFLSNEALAKHESTGLITWLVRGSSTIVFDESHLGLVEDVGVAALARRYGLGGAAILFIVFAGLCVWRRSATFVPSTDAAVDSVIIIDHTAGLRALLRRAVPAQSLIETCLAEFRPARSSDRPRVEAAIKNSDPYPVAQYNAALRSLRH